MKRTLVALAALLFGLGSTVATAQVTTSGAPIVSTQQTCSLTAIPLPAGAYQTGVVVQALTTNTGTVYVGGPGVTTSTGYPLVAGQAISYAAANSANIYIICTVASDAVSATGN